MIEKNLIVYLKPIQFPQKTWLDIHWKNVDPKTEIIGWRDGIWEHSHLHKFDDPNEYYKNMPPVKSFRWGGKLFFEDGFHRANFCLRYNKLLPVEIK